MKITKYISANILSLLGNIMSFLILNLMFLMTNPDLSFPKQEFVKSFYLNIFTLSEMFWNFGLYIILGLIILFIIEILLNKTAPNLYTINIEVKNKYLQNTYNVIFWFGIICSIIYMLIYGYSIYLLLSR